jgi:hypothetical protein
MFAIIKSSINPGEIVTVAADSSGEAVLVYCPKDAKDNGNEALAALLAEHDSSLKFRPNGVATWHARTAQTVGTYVSSVKWDRDVRQTDAPDFTVRVYVPTLVEQMEQERREAEAKAKKAEFERARAEKLAAEQVVAQ